MVPALTADGSTVSHIILSCEHAVSDGISWMLVAHEFLSGMAGESVPVAEHTWSAAFEVSLVSKGNTQCYFERMHPHPEYDIASLFRVSVLKLVCDQSACTFSADHK